MPTLSELCKEFGINSGDNESLEKTASAETEAAQLNDELSQETNSENGGDDMGLSELYNDTFGSEEVQNDTTQDVDLEKVAAAEAEALAAAQAEEDGGMEKLAAEWDAAGRFMAHGFFDELEKIAAAVEQMSDSEKLPQQLHAEGANKTQINDDSKLAVNNAEARNANADALKEKKS